MSKINVSLLLQTLGYIEENPHTWNQGHWRSLPVTPEGKAALQEATRCGANLCFAGHAAMLTGAKWQVTKKDLLEVVKKGDLPQDHEFNQSLALVKIPKDVLKENKGLFTKIQDEGDHYLNTDHDIRHPLTRERLVGFTAGGYAQVMLGLSTEQAHTLFEGDNDLDQLRSIVLMLVKHQMVTDGVWYDYDHLLES